MVGNVQMRAFLCRMACTVEPTTEQRIVIGVTVANILAGNVKSNFDRSAGGWLRVRCKIAEFRRRELVDEGHNVTEVEVGDLCLDGAGMNLEDRQILVANLIVDIE